MRISPFFAFLTKKRTFLTVRRPIFLVILMVLGRDTVERRFDFRAIYTISFDFNKDMLINVGCFRKYPEM